MKFPAPIKHPPGLRARRRPLELEIDVAKAVDPSSRGPHLSELIDAAAAGMGVRS